MRRRGGKRRDRSWVCAFLALASCASHTDEDAKACAGYVCSAGQCQAGPSGPECVCGAAEQAMHLACTLLRVDQGTDDDRDHARSIALNADVPGEIGVPAANRTQDVDVYRFEASAGRVYLIEVTSGPSLEVRIEDSAGNYQTSGSGTSLRLATPSAGETEYVTVKSTDSHEIGQYLLRITDLAAAAESSTLGPAPASVEGTIAPAGNVDGYALVVDAGVIYDIGCTFEPALPGSAALPVPGNPTRFRAQSGARYGVSVGGGQTGVGRYRCELTEAAVQDDVGDTVETALLLPEAPASFDGRGDVAFDNDVFGVHARPGKYLWAHTTACYAGFTTSPFVRGGFVTDAHPGLIGDELAYLVIYCESPGTYHLTLEELTDLEGNTPATATPIAPGIIQGRLEGPQDVDVFMFQAAAHHVYALEGTGLFGPSDLPVWNVTGPSLEQGAVQMDGGFARTFSVATSGPAFVSVGWRRDGSFSPPISYAVPLEDTGALDPEPGTPEDAIPSTVGVTIHGASNFGGDVDCYAFTLPPAQGFTAEPSTGVTTLFAPDGGSTTYLGQFQFDSDVGGRHILCLQTTTGTGGGIDGPSIPELGDYPYTLLVHP